MKQLSHSNKRKFILLLILFLISYVNSYSQVIQVNILGGAQVIAGQTIAITAGNSLIFRITNTDPNCNKLRVKNIILGNTTDFIIAPNKLKKKIYPVVCNNGENGERNHAKYFDFTVSSINTTCGIFTTTVTIKLKNLPDFIFNVTVTTSPVIYVLGGNPFATILNNSTTTSATNGTYFGVVAQGNSVTRTYIIANIGSCPLNINSLASSNPDFAVSSPYYAVPFYGLPPYNFIMFNVTFTAPVGGTGTQTSIISIANNDTAPNPFTFDVSAEMFNYSIPGPGGVTADFRLWLKSSRGISVASGSKLATWSDLGTNGKDATQPVIANQPTYLDNVADNINFNPVIKFTNDGASVEQYLYNSSNGFYSQDMYIVMVPDETILTSTTRRTIFSGVDSGHAGDLTGIGFGDYATRFTNEMLTYAQDVETPNGTFYGIADTSGTQNYQNPEIINARNNAAGNAMQILHNGNLLSTTEVNDTPPFANVGSVSGTGVTLGTPYKIGRNFDSQGSLNGRVAEILTFATRAPDIDRSKIESYLAIKYGITLGVNGTSKNYINSAGTVVWDVAANAGFNYNIAGIARDSISDLNQKQSKSVNDVNEVTIGLGGIFDTNSANPNEFPLDKTALMWGSNNASFTGISTNKVTIATGLTTSLTRIDRKWKIVETGADVGNQYIAIPKTAFSAFSKSANEEYALIVADNSNFSNSNIIDVIPLKIKLDLFGNTVLDKNGSQLYTTWYDFETTKYFTFGKVAKLTGNRAVNIGTNDYLVGEYALNLNTNSFTISAWIKSIPNTVPRTIMAKGAKLQIRLNSANKVEVYVDNVAPTITSTMAISDSKWHQVTFVYNSGTIILYIDGIVDSSVQNVIHPSPNYNRFSIGALYISDTNIINPFLGNIDEAYVWDIALSQNQIKYLMNQEVEKVTGNFVSGKVIPYTSSSNELVAIPWSNLRAYYNFNSFYGSTVEGQTDDRFFLRINYLKKNKAIVTAQTAPLPYISQADGTWDTPGTWLNNTVQIIPNSIGLNGTPIDWNIVQTTHNITSGNRNIDVLALIMNGGSLSLNGTLLATGTGTGYALGITHYLKLNGFIDLKGESQLVQTEGSVLEDASTGYITKDQQGTQSSYNYNYWTSSVGPINQPNNTSFKISGVLYDGTTSTPQPITFKPAYNAADLAVTSPITLSTYWMYTFNGADNNYYAWHKIDENTPILPGEGFTMKGTSGTAAITDNQNYIFKGKPYNGDFSLPIIKGQDRLIGNPYPSALDADEFILDNIKTTDPINGPFGRNTVNVFNGALYFWHHFGGKTHHLSGYVGGYATYTLMGGTMAYASDARINNTGTPGGNKIPERYIPVNQGFFVVAALDPSLSGTTTTVDGGNILFKNSQRAFVPEAGATMTNNGSLFFKAHSYSYTKNSTVNTKTKGKEKIRLGFISSTGYHRQLLVGTDYRATANFDLGFDAPMADVNADDMFWKFSGGKFVIQAVHSFDNSVELPLGIKVNENGLITIKIDSLENIPSSLQLFVKDNLTGQTSNLRNADDVIALNAGTYNNRFSLVFKPTATLKVNNEIFGKNILIYYSKQKHAIEIKNNSQYDINKIKLYNYLGQTLKVWHKNLNNTNLSLPVNNGISGVYILTINTTKGLVNKKIIID